MKKKTKSKIQCRFEKWISAATKKLSLHKIGKLKEKINIFQSNYLTCHVDLNEWQYKLIDQFKIFTAEKLALI
ncbi:hypothetical protein BpHYR1_051891 [Brachionus plicatilis]|uniref:Uncharacterized protein n=1 Tax=Brachionus plicatilis TaxID=10195 RepID=A0A3M7RLP4_BRAPC|nr:hypothetical protein BpHYR1_051891 [Brachionus plicatilis]